MHDIFDTTIENIPIGMRVGDSTYIDSCEDNRIFLRSDDDKAYIDWNIIKVYKDNYEIVVRKPIILTNNKYGDFEDLNIYNGSSVVILANNVRNLNIECNYLNCDYSYCFENCNINCSFIKSDNIVKFNNCNINAVNLNLCGYYDSVHDIINKYFDNELKSNIKDLPLLLGIGNIQNTWRIFLRKDYNNSLSFSKDSDGIWTLNVLKEGWHFLVLDKKQTLDYLESILKDISKAF